jgi:hypothetical protein
MPDDLSKILRALAKLQRVSGANSSAAEVKKLAELTDSLGERARSAELLASEIENIDLVSYFSHGLEACGKDRSAFNKFVTLMSKSKLLTNKQINEIAFAYVGGRPKYSSKKAAIDAIKLRFARLELFESKKKAS